MNSPDKQMVDAAWMEGRKEGCSLMGMAARFMKKEETLEEKVIDEGGRSEGHPNRTPPACPFMAIAAKRHSKNFILGTQRVRQS